MQRIFTPFAAASAISFRCFSMESCLIFSSDSCVGVLQVAWIKPHRTVPGITNVLSEFFGTNARINGALVPSLHLCTTDNECGQTSRELRQLREWGREIAAPI